MRSVVGACANGERSVEDVNVIASMYADKLLGDIQLDPGHGALAFCCCSPCAVAVRWGIVWG